MAVLDAKLVLSDAQAETTAAAHDSDNVIDLGIGTDGWGTAKSADYGEAPHMMWLHAYVNTTFTSGGSATLTVALQDSADNSSFAAVTPAVTTAAIAVASLAAGYELIRMPLPVGLRRYVKLVYTIGTASMTAGKIDAWIGPPKGEN
jgi:hypothetical protein